MKNHLSVSEIPNGIHQHLQKENKKKDWKTTENKKKRKKKETRKTYVCRQSSRKNILTILCREIRKTLALRSFRSYLDKVFIRPFHSVPFLDACVYSYNVSLFAPFPLHICSKNQEKKYQRVLKKKKKLSELCIRDIVDILSKK